VDYCWLFTCCFAPLAAIVAKLACALTDLVTRSLLSLAPVLSLLSQYGLDDAAFAAAAQSRLKLEQVCEAVVLFSVLRSRPLRAVARLRGPCLPCAAGF
jgi:hypothetical protein